MDWINNDEPGSIVTLDKCDAPNGWQLSVLKIEGRGRWLWQADKIGAVDYTFGWADSRGTARHHAEKFYQNEVQK